MPTGQDHVNIYNKQMVPQQGWDTYFFRYLDEKTNEANRAAFLRSGVLSDKTIGLTSSANDTFSADISLADRGIDGFGHIMDLSLADSVEIADIAFENANTIDYYVGFRYQSVDSAAERNPRTTSAEYPWEMDTIGELGDPDSVTDNTTYIRLVVDGLTESSVDHSGRLVRVWLKDPVNPVASVAYYYGTIVYGGGVNYVDIPYSSTQGPLGQTAPTFPISTTASDYSVLVRGLSWFRNTDISNDANYVFIGTVTGSGAGTTPTVFDITDQYNALLITLQRAYEGSSLDDPAPGRIINATKHAVELRQSASVSAEQDPFNQAFLIDKREERGVLFSGGVGMMGAPGGFSPEHWTMALYEGPATTLEESEPIDLAVGTNRIDFTRGAVDLTQYTSFFNGRNPVVKVSGTTNWDGYYFPDQTSLLAGSIEVFDVGFGAPSFAAESGQANLLLTLSNNLFGDPFAASEEVGFNSINHTLLRGMSGVQTRMFDAPRKPRSQFFHRANVIFNREDNLFWDLFSGRQEMRGGGIDYFNVRYNIEDDVTGWAHYKSDKRFNTFETEFQPVEADSEWGFDYRGSAFGKVGSPGYQLAATDRIPFTLTDGATQLIITEEPFTAFSATQLQFTRGGDLDLSYIPAWHYHGKSFVWAEIQFDTPSVSDGVYSAELFTAPDKLTFRTVDGTQAAFTATETGVVRFYGGMYSGTYWMNSGSELRSYVTNIVAPTRDSGALRMWSLGEQAIGSPTYKYHIGLATGYDDTSFAFGVRDGGVVFARSLTTRDWSTSHELIQWDQLDTALLTCDTVQADLAQVTEIDLLEAARELVLPVSLGSSNVVKKNGGGTWSVSRMIDPYRGLCSDSTGAMTWASLTAGNPGIYSRVSGGNYRIGVKVPFGATLTSIDIKCTPNIGDGSANALTAEIFRFKHSDLTQASLLTTGAVIASGGDGTPQTVTFTADQNNTAVDNGGFYFFIQLAASTPSNDIVKSIQLNYSVDKLGKSWFDIY